MRVALQCHILGISLRIFRMETKTDAGTEKIFLLFDNMIKDSSDQNTLFSQTSLTAHRVTQFLPFIYKIVRRNIEETIYIAKFKQNIAVFNIDTSYPILSLNTERHNIYKMRMIYIIFSVLK